MADRIPKCPRCRKPAALVRQKTTEVIYWRVAEVHPSGDVPMFIMGNQGRDCCVIATCSAPSCRHEWCPRGVSELADLQKERKP